MNKVLGDLTYRVYKTYDEEASHAATYFILALLGTGVYFCEDKVGVS